MNKISILLVDDKILHSDLIKSKLINLGYGNVIIRNSYESAVEYLDTHTPEIVILDYYLDKSHTGLELVKECLMNTEVNIIFTSSFYGDEVFREIVEILPTDFIPKNATEFDLDKVIKLAIARMGIVKHNKKIRDFIFVRYGKLITKLAVANIEYMEVDGKYLNLYADSKKYLVRSTLSDFIQMLPDNFVKVHQAYVVNLRFSESINVEEGTIKVGKVNVPFSRNHKKDLLNVYYHP
jgi:DNA-binding LytR/AlgR family response regulator